MLISEVQFEKSADSIIRYINVTDMEFSIDQLEIFKNILCNYFRATHYRIAHRHNTTYFLIEDNRVTENKVILGQEEKYHEQVIAKMRVEGWINGETFDEFIFRISCPNTVEKVDVKHIKQDVVKMCKVAIKQIEQIIYDIQSCKVFKSQFKEFIAISYEDFYGRYDFGSLLVDFGCPNIQRRENKIAFCLISYKKYYVESSVLQLPYFEFIERESKIKLTLLQTFLRFPIFHSVEGIAFQPSGVDGKLTVVNRNNLATDYIERFYNNAVVPHDVKDLFQGYENLNYECKSAFLLACESYVEGLKGKNPQAVTNFVIALEKLASFDVSRGKQTVNPGDTKTEHIQRLVNRVTRYRAIDEESVNYLYNIRCNYVHEGMANNELKSSIFFINHVTSEDRKKAERITNYTLINWLKEEVCD